MRLFRSSLVGLICLAGASQALELKIDSLSCTQVLWTTTLSVSEWIQCSKLQFFVQDPQGINTGQSFNGTCSTTGDIPSAGLRSFRSELQSSPNADTWQTGINIYQDDGQIATGSDGSPLSVVLNQPVNNCATNVAAVSTASPTSSENFATRLFSTRSSGFANAGPTRSLATPTFTYNNDSYRSRVVNTGAIVGGVIGALALLITALLLAWLLVRRRRQRAQQAKYNDSLKYNPVPTMENAHNGGASGSYAGGAQSQSYNSSAPASAPYDTPYANAGSAASPSGAGAAGLGTGLGAGAGAAAGVGAAAAATHSSNTGSHADPTTSQSYPTNLAQQSTYGAGVTAPPTMSADMLSRTGSGEASAGQGNVGGFANPHDAGLHNPNAAPTDAEPRPNPLLGAMPDWTPGSSMPVAEPGASAHDEAPAYPGPSSEVVLPEPASRSGRE